MVILLRLIVSRRLASFLVVLCSLVGAGSASAATGPVLAGSFGDATDLSGALAVAVSGHYAYTTAYYAGKLTVVDVSNPVSPVVVGSTPSTPSLENGSGVNIVGNLAFVASKNRNGPCTPGPPPNSCGTGSNDDGTGNSLTVVDISNPAAPTIVSSGSVHDAQKLFGAYGVAVSGHYAFVASQGLLSGQPTSPDTSRGSFSVVDLNNLSAGVVATIDNGLLPSPWTGTNALQHATAVAISGNYAYVTAFYSQRLTVIDISNPLSPKIVASLSDPRLGFNADVAVQGNYAYVADQTGGSSDQLAVVDVSTPTSPKIVGALSDSALLDGAYRIRVHGYFAYISASSAATVAAIDISDPTKPRVAGAVTDSAHLNVTTGLDLYMPAGYVIASSIRLPSQLGTTYPSYPLQTGGPVDTGTISAIQLDPLPISVAITPASEPPNPTTQTSASFSFSANDSVAAFQCGLDGAALGTCTTPTSEQYTGLGIGSHTFTVQATDAAGNTATANYNWSVDQAPVNMSPPTISGTASAGQMLTASPGSWSGNPAPTYSYQWLRCDQNGQNCTTISTAKSSTYLLPSSDAGFTFEVTVTATNSSGSPSATSSPTAVVTAPPLNMSPPTISGTAAAGQTLTASPGVWSGYPAPMYSYLWSRCDQNAQNCSSISTATNSTFALQSLDAGSTFEVTVTATNSSAAPSATSVPTAVAQASASPPANTSPPTISGTPAAGQTLTASPGVWSGYPAPMYSYLWSRCDQNAQNCSAISMATSSTFALQSNAGSTFEVTVTATNGSGPPASATSTPTAVVTAPPANTSPPTISGTAAAGQTLTASPGVWSGYPAPMYSYLWSRCDQNAQNCNTISTATSSTYALQVADVGATFKVSVAATNSSGSSSASSGLSGRVAGAPVLHAAPRVSGTAQQGDQLKGINGSWSGYPAPGFVYRWQRCDSAAAHCSTVSGQTAPIYTLGASDVGHRIRFVVVASNGSGSTSVTSAATSVVTASQKSARLAKSQSARLVGVVAGKPSLRVTLVGVDSGARLDRVAVALPPGMSFARWVNGVPKGITVAEPRGPHVRVVESMVRGSLVLTMRNPATSIQLAVGGRAIAVSRRLATSVREKKIRTLGVTITILGNWRRATKLRLQFHVQ